MFFRDYKQALGVTTTCDTNFSLHARIHREVKMKRNKSTKFPCLL